MTSKRQEVISQSEPIRGDGLASRIPQIEDRLLEHYDRKYASEAVSGSPTPLSLHQPRPADRNQAALAFVPPRLPAKAEILELGAGEGAIAESMRVGGVDFAAYTIGDLSDVRLKGLKRNLTNKRYRFVQSDAENVSGTVQGHFDAVVMVALIEHLVDPIGAMAAIRSLLKPGGFVYIDTPNMAKWTRRVRLALGRFPSTASANEGLTTYGGEPVDLYEEGHLHYFTFRSLTLMLTQRCGFSKVEPCPYFLSPRQLGSPLGTFLARLRPTVFSELACAAYA